MIKVSALVSLYNSIEFVEECLHDLVAQSLYKRGVLEIVVIDSASPQDERSVVDRFCARYDNIVYHRTPERESLYQAWNRGISLAQGEYLTNANSDDRHHPECLEVLSRALDARPAVSLVYSDVFESVVPNERFGDNPRGTRYTYPDYFAPLSLLYYQFGCQPMWRRSVHERIGGFNGQLRAAGDWEFSIRFSLAGLRALRVPQVLGSFLNRPTSISCQDSTSTREQQQIRQYYLTPENIVALYGVEGFPVSNEGQRAQAFADFTLRASRMALPWTPGKIYQDPHAMMISSQAVAGAR